VEAYLLEFVHLRIFPQHALPYHNFRLCIAGPAILLVYPMANNKFFSQSLDDWDIYSRFCACLDVCHCISFSPPSNYCLGIRIWE
jgi:hypothetical protein